jgi:hypothetical protein
MHPSIYFVKQSLHVKWHVNAIQTLEILKISGSSKYFLQGHWLFIGVDVLFLLLNKIIKQIIAQIYKNTNLNFVKIYNI